MQLGTGTWDVNRWVTELQAGSYTLMDTSYAAWRLGTPTRGRRNAPCFPALRLLENLAAITTNDPMNQVLAAVTLIKMNVTPVVSMHIPFGGDNHTDTDLVNETKQTVAA